MINVLNLFWIVPLSMIIGAVILICIACIMVGKVSEEEEQEILRKIEEEEMKRRMRERK